jgi:hypothetical protein
MTMATDGRQIKELAGIEKERELQLRYAGAIKTLVQNELRVTAARLIAAFPFTNRQDFLACAEEVWTAVVGDVSMEARDARHSQLAGPEAVASPAPVEERVSRVPRTPRAMLIRFTTITKTMRI